MADGAARGFETPPEVLAYFAEKAMTPRFSWLDVWAEEHGRAFTVAKATNLDLLKAFKTSIQQALERGQGFETWRAGIEPELRRLGWWGPRRVEDPDLKDDARLVDFSKPRRLRTIFWSNMNAARAAGQWDRIQRTKRALPYILYVRTSASDPRPEHLRWAGTILPADDPFWRTHFPPNGWGCKCTVRQITRRERDRLLARPPGPDGSSYSDTAPPTPTRRPFRNRRTGEVSLVPEGIDPGWHTNPGIARQAAVRRKLAQAEQDVGLRLEAREAAEKAARQLFGDSELEAARSAMRDRLARLGADHADVTPDQALLVRWYTEDGYLDLNEALRGGAASLEYLTMRDGLNGALEALGTTRHDVVRRGITVDDLAAAGEVYRLGRIIQFDAFTSASLPPATGFDGNLRFVLLSRTGRSVQDLSQHPSEREVLFKAGTGFKVVAVDQQDGHLTVTLEEVEETETSGRLAASVPTPGKIRKVTDLRAFFTDHLELDREHLRRKMQSAGLGRVVD